MVDSVKDLLVKFVRRICKKEIEDFYIKLPDGSTISVTPDVKVSLALQNGKLVSFDYDTPPASQ